MTSDLPCSRDHGTPATQFPEQLLRAYPRWMAHSREVVAEVTLPGRLLQISPNIRSVLGYDPAAVIGTSIFDHVHPDDLATVRDRFVSPQGWGTFRFRHANGTWLWLEAAAQRFAGPDGADRLWLVARDVTGRKLAEDERNLLAAQLRQAHKSGAPDSLLGGIVHDFGNILAAVMLNAELLRLETTDQPRTQQRLDQIVAAGKRAKQLVHQLMDSGGSPAADRVPIGLADVITEVIGLLGPTLAGNVTMRADVRDSSSLVLANPLQVHQVLMNLCLNAAQAMPAGGHIDVRLDSFLVDGGYHRTSPGLPAGAHVRLTVADNGSGMLPAIRERMFEPYFTTKGQGEGTGLGLTVVRRVMDQHQGAIHVSSQPGQGTVIELFFPRHEAHGAPGR